MSATTVKCRYETRQGFTLLELVIVTAILAILAGIAVRSMDGLDEQARFEATQRVMRDANDAVLASRPDADGSLLISGFVADIGRLPKAVVGPDGSLQLLELWSNPGGLVPFKVQQALNLQFGSSTYSDSEVFIASGWRGNYMRLGVGQSSLLDGWGNPLGNAAGVPPCLLKVDGTAATVGDPVGAVRFNGANDAGTNSSYATPITVPFGGVSTGVDPSVATVSGSISWVDTKAGDATFGQAAAPNGPVTVLCFGPDGLSGAPSVQAVTIPAAPYTYSFAGTAGPRVIRAYQGNSTITLTPGTDWSSTTSAPIRSAPVQLMVPPGGQVKDLVVVGPSS
jgi:prepilin-type N-terminal cleavage/methylation domain-containing protein